MLFLRYYISFLKGDKAGMDRAVARARGAPGEGPISYSQALVLARSGQLRLARGMSRRAVDLAQQAGLRERAATHETGVAIWEAFFGNAPEARRSAMAALELSNGRDVEYGVAFALALAGDSSRPEALANDLERRFPEDTSVRYTYLATLRALYALNRGDSANAIELLQVAVPYELAMPGIAFVGFFGGLYPAYVRGEAFLHARQGAAAATEFQKILDHRGIVVADPVGALARLQLGRMSALSAGDMDQGKDCLPGSPGPLERRRPGNPGSQASQGGMRQAAIIPQGKSTGPRTPEPQSRTEQFTWNKWLSPSGN